MKSEKPFLLVRETYSERWGWCIEATPSRAPAWVHELASWLLAGLFCGMLFMLVLLFGGS